MPPKKKSAGKPRTPREKRDVIDRAKVMRDLQKVLKTNGIISRIEAVSFSSVKGTTCTCPNGSTGVLRVVAGKLICVCPN